MRCLGASWRWESRSRPAASRASVYSNRVAPPAIEGIRQAAEQAMAARAVPGMIVMWARRGRDGGALFLGTDADGVRLGPRMSGGVRGPEPIATVASITKLATALAVLRLVDSGTVSLDDPLGAHVPDA